MEREGQADQKQKRDTQPIRQFMVDTNNEKRKKRKAQHHLCTPTSKKGTEESYAQPPHTTPESGKDDMAISTRHPAMMSGTLSRNITDVLYECNPTRHDKTGKGFQLGGRGVKRQNYGGSDSPAKRKNVNFDSLLRFWGDREVSATVNPIVEGLGGQRITNFGAIIKLFDTSAG